MGNEQHQNPKSDIEIARGATLRNITEISDKLGIPGHGLLPYGHVKAKVDPEYAETLKDKPNGKLILVAGITPTPAGEGKTTTSVGLGDARGEQTLGGGTAGLLGGLQGTVPAHLVDGLVDVAVGLGERLLAVHHAGVGLVAEFFDLGCGDCHFW
jgi:hypothetical protein